MSTSAASVSVAVDDGTASLPRCPLCRRIRWTFPIKILQCGHSFCQRCLLRLSHSRTEYILGMWANYNYIECPRCKIVSTTACWGQIKQLPTNFDLQYLFELIYASKGMPLKTEKPDQLDDTDGDSDMSSINDSVTPPKTYSDSVSVYAMTVWMGPYEERNDLASHRTTSAVEDDSSIGDQESGQSANDDDEGRQSNRIEDESVSSYDYTYTLYH